MGRRRESGGSVSAQRPGAARRADEIRVFALVGHPGAGKTTLAELLLTTTGAVRGAGEVERGTTLLDHHPEERRRGQTLLPGFAWLEWADTIVQLIDTPGSAVVDHERALAMAGADGAVVVLDAAAGVESGTRRSLADCAARDLPALAVVNKVDRAPDRLSDLVAELEQTSGRRAVLVHLPYVEDGELAGIVSLRDEVVLRYAPDGSGAFSPEPLPTRIAAEARAARERLVESVALTQDELLEHYLEYLELPEDGFRDGLIDGVRSRALLPVLIASAAASIGAQPLLDAICELLPAAGSVTREARGPDGTPVILGVDGPFCAQLLSTRLDDQGDLYHVLRVVSGSPPHRAWTHAQSGREARVHKLYELRGPRRRSASYAGPGAIVATWDRLPGRPGDTFTESSRLALPVPAILAPMMALAVAPAGRGPGGDPKFTQALQDLLALDRALELGVDETTGGVLLAGSGEGHLERAVARLQERYGAPVAAELPPVGYREMPVRAVSDVEGVHLREDSDGTIAEYGACTVDLIPRGLDATPVEDAAPVVENTVDDLEALPEKYWPAIGQGFRLAMQRGPTAGYPVIGLDVRLKGGDYNMLSSTDDHLRLAGERALRAALSRSGTRLLEPWCRLRVHVPRDRVGEVLTDLVAHRGRILGMDMGPANGPAASPAEVHIEAVAPYRETRTFATRLQTKTAGEGRFEVAISHYEPVPGHLVRDAIVASPFREPGPAGALGLRDVGRRVAERESKG